MVELLSGTTLYVVGVVAVVLVALVIGKFNVKKNVPSLEVILKYAQVAIRAVEKLSDNGQYAGLDPAERHARKKADAMQFIEEALRTEFNIKPNAVMRYLIDMAIEAALKQMEEK